ncbi:MAG: FecR domain-containing protein [Rhodoferax sp.]|nr:FecR domain-containing protein [Rhodoferax sp.]
MAADEPSVPYTVKPGDKLIAMAAHLFPGPDDWTEVARFNHLKNPNVIRPGQILQIPLHLLQSQSAIGKIISTFGDVQLAGSPAAVGSAVPEGGKLQTGANSSAVVELADGSRITMLPNTLAEVVTSRSYALRNAAASGSTTWFSGLVRLAQGALQTVANKAAHRATPLQIETPTSLVGVRGTQFRVAYDDPATKNARTEVLEGLVKADNTAQSSFADVARGQGALLNPAVKDIKVVALLKAPDLSGAPFDIFKPEALWPMPTLDGASRFRVQVASDESFDKIVRDMVVTTGNADFSSVPNGSWFARVRGIDASGIEGFDSVKAVQVVLRPPVPQPPTPWRIGEDRLSVASGHQILQFSQVGLDASHTIVATVTADTPAATRIAQATARGDSPRITLDLGQLEAGTRYQLHLTVTQADGARVIPLDYRFVARDGWGWAEGTLQPMKPGTP